MTNFSLAGVNGGEMKSNDFNEIENLKSELDKTKRNFRLFFDESPIPYQSLDENGNFLDVNPAWCDSLGYSREEVVGKNFAEFLTPGYAEHFKDNFKGFKVAGEIRGVEFQMKCKDGTLIQVSYDGNIGYDESGKFKQTYCMFQDITERKKAEKEIEESHNSLKATINAIPDLLFEVDEEGQFYDYNAPITDELYVSPKKFLGKKVSEVLPPEAADKIMEALKEASEKGKHQGMTYKLVFPDGTRYFELSIAKKPDDSLKRLIALVRDITQRKESEQKIKQSLQEKETLLKEIHHRVKNNLQVISSLLNLQSEYVKDKNDQELFRESQTRARSMALIHEHLYQSTDLRSINFDDYIKILVYDLYNTYGCRPDNIELKLGLEPIMLDINTAIPCGLILNELMSNAIKHAFPGDNKGKIQVNFHQKDHELILTVKDNGIGFPEDMGFETTDSLGLKIVNTLINQIEGELKINSQEGTEIIVTFPEVIFD